VGKLYNPCAMVNLVDYFRGVEVESGELSGRNLRLSLDGVNQKFLAITLRDIRRHDQPEVPKKLSKPHHTYPGAGCSKQNRFANYSYSVIVISIVLVHQPAGVKKT
jgi:hypothetical protein